MNLPALSIRQPWAHLILHCGKDVENRTWATTFRGRVLIHASKGCTQMEYESARMFVVTDIPQDVEFPPFDVLVRGGIIGEVEIVDCVQKSGSPWFCGPYGFVLQNPKWLPFQPCRGALKFFRPDLRPSASICG